MIIFAGVNGHLSDIAVEKVRTFEGKFHKFMAEKYPAVGETLREKKKMDDDLAHRLIHAIEEFKKVFAGES